MGIVVLLVPSRNSAAVKDTEIRNIKYKRCADPRLCRIVSNTCGPNTNNTNNSKKTLAKGQDLWGIEVTFFDIHNMNLTL